MKNFYHAFILLLINNYLYHNIKKQLFFKQNLPIITIVVTQRQRASLSAQADNPGFLNSPLWRGGRRSLTGWFLKELT